VLDRELDEGGIGLRVEQVHHRIGDFGHGFRAVDRQRSLGEREPVDVAVDQRVGVGGHLDRKPGRPQGADVGFEMPQRSRARLLDGTYGVVNPLSPWTGFAVMCAYAVVLIGFAAWRLRRLDA